MRQARQSAFVLAVTLGAIVACQAESTGPDPSVAQGTYVLESVTGREAAVGAIVLSAAGGAERRVRYAQPAGGLSVEYVARGTFSLSDDGTVDLQLREDDGRSAYLWLPHASLSGRVLQLRHPDPADGPDIIESYRRQ